MNTRIRHVVLAVATLWPTACAPEPGGETDNATGYVVVIADVVVADICAEEGAVGVWLESIPDEVPPRRLVVNSASRVAVATNRDERSVRRTRVRAPGS